MTIQLHTWPTRVPSFIPGNTGGAFSSATAITTATGSPHLAFIGHFRHPDGAGNTMTVSKVAVNWGTMTFSGTTARIGVQGVAAAGPPARPDGTYKGATNNALVTFTSASSNTWTEYTLTETFTATHGEALAIVIDITVTGTTPSITVRGANANIFASASPNWPLCERFDGTSTYTAQGIAVNCAFSDGSRYASFAGAMPASSFAAASYQDSTNPDEYGLLFNMPWPCTIEGMQMPADFNNTATADIDYKFYSDPLGTPVAEQTRSFDAQLHRASGTAQSVDWLFDNASEALAKDTNYVMGIKATGSSVFDFPYFTVANATIRDDIYGGLRLVSRNAGSGAFAEVSSGLAIPQMSLLVCGFDDGAGGGGGGGGLRVIGG